MLLVVTAKAVRASQHSANAMEAWVSPMVETTIDVANKATGAAINKREFCVPSALPRRPSGMRSRMKKPRRAEAGPAVMPKKKALAIMRG